jgi:hypothetical protein
MLRVLLGTTATDGHDPRLAVDRETLTEAASAVDPLRAGLRTCPHRVPTVSMEELLWNSPGLEMGRPEQRLRIRCRNSRLVVRYNQLHHRWGAESPVAPPFPSRHLFGERLTSNAMVAGWSSIECPLRGNLLSYLDGVDKGPPAESFRGRRSGHQKSRRRRYVRGCDQSAVGTVAGRGGRL